MTLHKLFYKTSMAGSLIQEVAQPKGIERGFRSYTAKDNLEHGLFHVGAALGTIINPVHGLMMYGISCMLQFDDQPFDQFSKIKQFNDGLSEVKGATLVLKKIEGQHADQSVLSELIEALEAPLALGSQSKIGKIYVETQKLTKGTAKDGFFVSAKAKVERRLARLKSRTGDQEDLEGKRFTSAYKRLYSIYMQVEQTKND